MDSDQLNHAAQIIERIPENAERDKVSLSGILQLRQAVAVGSANPALIAQYQSLSGKPGIGADFLKRQQFKILADLVSKSSDAADKIALQHALDAFDLATKERVPLVGARDLMRWQAVQQKVLNGVGGRGKEVSVRAPTNTSGTPLKLSLPGHTSPQEVEVPETTLRAAQITRVVGPEKLAQMRSRLFYDGNRLSLPPTEKLDSAHMKERLKAAGIKVVSQ
jgi:hypothetical protein